MADEKKAVSQIRDEVAEVLLSSGDTVRDMTKKDLADKELEKRKTSVLAIITRVGELEKELQKAQKGGTQLYTKEGTPVGEPTYNKQQLEEMKKVQENIERLEAAVSNALKEGSVGNWNKVHELAEKK